MSVYSMVAANTVPMLNLCYGLIVVGGFSFMMLAVCSLGE